MSAPTLTTSQQIEAVEAALAEAGYVARAYFGRCQCGHDAPECDAEQIRVDHSYRIPDAVLWRAFVTIAPAAGWDVACWTCWRSGIEAEDCAHDYRTSEQPALPPRPASVVTPDPYDPTT